MIFTALIVKFLSAGAVAQAATGATVAVVAFTGVGAVGALPDPVQDTFATVVAEITPLEPPTSEEPTGEVVPEEETLAEEVEVTEEVAEVPEVPADAEVLAAQVQAWALEGPADGESISEWAGEGSKEDVKAWLRDRGMTFGNVVSKWASGKEFSAEELAALGAEDDQSSEAPVEPDADVVVEESETETAEVATEDRGSRGNGKGTSNGSSNGKSKGNGKN